MDDNLKLIEEIRKSTNIRHQAVEGKFSQLLDEVESLEDYAVLLNVVYGFMNPLERAIHTFIDKKLVPDIEQRRSTALLLKDMDAIGYPYTATSVYGIDFIKDTYQAMGALYVMEGSALGGTIIARMIKTKLNLTTGTTYFESNGLARPLLWKNFLLQLENPLLLPYKNSIATAAETTFLQFEKKITKALKQKA